MSVLQQRFEELLMQRRDISRLDGVSALLDWDMETLMPRAGSDARAEMTALVAALAHERLTSETYSNSIRYLHDRRQTLPEPWQRRAVDLEYRRWYRASKLPADFVREMARLTSSAHHIWVEAKQGSNYAAFAPTLGQIVEMKRREVALLGTGADHPYDVLLDEYEPGTTVEQLVPMFHELTSFLTPFVRKIVGKRVWPTEQGNVHIRGSLADQERLVRELAQMLRFSEERGCIGVAAHPFMTTIHAGDSRIAISYKEDDVLDGVYSTVHEVGHALYEQGLPRAWNGLGIGDAISLGVHESQSRLWENNVGRSRAFAEVLRFSLQSHLPTCRPMNADTLFRCMNVVRPSFIRTEADEVTYNLHVALRFDIERRLIEGSLDVGDVRDAWNMLTRELFGLEVEDDAQGVLQDVHWSAGLFGYFPTYTLGNLYAAQLHEKAFLDIPDLEHRIANGDFATLLGWLREKIHRHGSMFGPRALITRATGREPDATAFISYLTRKYGELYGV